MNNVQTTFAARFRIHCFIQEDHALLEMGNARPEIFPCHGI